MLNIIIYFWEILARVLGIRIILAGNDETLRREQTRPVRNAIEIEMNWPEEELNDGGGSSVAIGSVVAAGERRERERVAENWKEEDVRTVLGFC